MKPLVRACSAGCAIVGAAALLFSQWAASVLLFLAAVLLAYAARMY